MSISSYYSTLYTFLSVKNECFMASYIYQVCTEKVLQVLQSANVYIRRYIADILPIRRKPYTINHIIDTSNIRPSIPVFDDHQRSVIKHHIETG